MDDIGFRPLLADLCVYRRGSAWILLYVDDIILIGSVWEDLDHIKKYDIRETRGKRSRGTQQLPWSGTFSRPTGSLAFAEPFRHRNS